jgi:hypothetical protein
MNKKLELTPIFYSMGFELNGLHYMVGGDKCTLLIPEKYEDIEFAEKMKKAEGVPLYNWLAVARETARDEPKKFEITCPQKDCSNCEKFKDYSKRLLENSPSELVELA